ncbi:MAG: NAD(P)H-dependent oxidoreductase [Christensenellaceae bacterium]
MVNGSPHAEGCTYTALKEVEKALNADGVETELFSWARPRFRAASVRRCRRQGKCFIDDKVNDLRRKRLPPTDLCSVRPCITPPPAGHDLVMDRAFTAGKIAWFKPAAVVRSPREAPPRSI